MNINELKEYQAKFVSYNDLKKNEYRIIDKLRKKFVKYFSIDKILKLELDEYVIGKGQPSFCNRIENELNEWGNIHGSRADKFGIYFGKKGEDKTQKYRIGNKSFGTEIKHAFENIKSDILKLLNESDDIESLKANRISPMFKGKILSVYYPEKFLNIFSKTHLDYFINILGLENNVETELEKQKVLLEFKNNDVYMKEWNIFTFSKFLYDSFGAPTSSKLPNELKKYQLPPFPHLENIEYEFVDLEFSQINEDLNSNKTIKLDYSSQSKIFKRIGDIGELIIMKVEKDYLKKNKLQYLTSEIKHVSIKDDSKGYDIMSFDKKGNKKYIEVKSTKNSMGDNTLYISDNELNVAKKTPNYYFYIVYEVLTKRPRICKINAKDFLNKIKLVPISYKVNFSSSLTKYTGHSIIG